MKTKLITLLIAIVALLGSAYAQTKVNVYKNGTIVYSEYITDVDSIKFEKQTIPIPSEENGHEYVDLGLPSGLKWATCNVGATTPEEYGDYFAWGETEPKTTYSWSTYKYCNGAYDTMTKYCEKSSNGTVDNKSTLKLTDDAAYVNWGGKWRMPTKEEQDELRNTSNCTWTWTTQNGVNGYKVTSKKNGNSIFLPAAGNRDYYGLGDAGSRGYYWSSSLYADNNNSAYYVGFSSGTVGWYGGNRCNGQSVRAVCDPSTPTPVYTVSVSATEGGTAEASATEVEQCSTVTLTATPNEGYSFVNWTVNGEVVSSKNPYTATVMANTEYIANFNKVENGHAYVDLGLPSGLKWATCNVGADSPEGYGDYFAWGETQPKSYYDWSTYKYCNGSYKTMTKYCKDSYYGKVDNKTTLEHTDDAARVNWGGKWRMPTRAEQDELRNTSNCTWTWTTQNGVKGYKVTSKKNGNSIFLPFAGCRGYDCNDFAGSNGYYWSSSLDPSDNNNAYYVYFYPSGIDWSYRSRCNGYSVRAVCETVYTVSVSATEGGTAEASATEVEKGTSVTLTATPQDGYYFVNWTVNGEEVSTQATYTSVIKVDTEIVANFKYCGYVDLGLPSGLKWATCNVGATTPEEYGDYFAWGETEPKDNYSWSTYKYCNGSEYIMTKYCTDSYYGTVDNKTTLELTDDAARVNWGGKWRMPTSAEQDELRNTSNCTWTWTTQNGVNGYKVTSKKNGNSIFLPAAGYRDYDRLGSAGSVGNYWSSSLRSSYSNYAYNVYFDSGSVYLDYYYRCYGRSVRAVYESVYTVSVSATVGGTAEASATEVEEGTSVTLTATPNEGYRFVNWTVNGVEVSKENPYIVAVTSDIEFKANFKGEENGHEYVDLGLPSGLKWATCNVGATSPEEYGDYFAWGETEPKDYYDWSTYKYCNGTYDTMTKYCTNSSYGTVDKKNTLELTDDAAHVNWGGKWRMPTLAEQEELLNTSNCTWTWTTQNGVNGYKVTSKKNSNSIFLPFAGCRYYGYLSGAGTYFRYWSSSLNTAYSVSACYVDYESYSVGLYYGNRCNGQSVRAVCP